MAHNRGGDSGMPHSSAAAAAAHSSSATSSSSAGATASVRVGQVMTPASLVVCARRQGDEEGATSQPVRRVLRMERHLHERLSAEDGDFLLHRDMARDLMAEGRLAAARDVSGLWARARVEQVLRLPDGDQAQVFLLDHGRSVRVRRPDASLRPLLRREDPARVPPLAQTFILLGLQPVEMALDPASAPDSQGQSLVLARDWSPLARSLVVAATDAADHIWLSANQSNLPYPPFYGDLILCFGAADVPRSHFRFFEHLLPSSEFADVSISLSDLLVSNGLAANVGRSIHLQVPQSSQAKLHTVAQSQHHSWDSGDESCGGGGRGRDESILRQEGDVVGHDASMTSAKFQRYRKERDMRKEKDAVKQHYRVYLSNQAGAEGDICSRSSSNSGKGIGGTDAWRAVAPPRRPIEVYSTPPPAPGSLVPAGHRLPSCEDIDGPFFDPGPRTRHRPLGAPSSSSGKKEPVPWDNYRKKDDKSSPSTPGRAVRDSNSPSLRLPEPNAFVNSDPLWSRDSVEASSAERSRGAGDSREYDGRHRLHLHLASRRSLRTEREEPLPPPPRPVPQVRQGPAVVTSSSDSGVEAAAAAFPALGPKASEVAAILAAKKEEEEEAQRRRAEEPAAAETRGMGRASKFLAKCEVGGLRLPGKLVPAEESDTSFFTSTSTSRLSNYDTARSDPKTASLPDGAPGKNPKDGEGEGDLLDDGDDEIFRSIDVSAIKGNYVMKKFLCQQHHRHPPGERCPGFRTERKQQPPPIQHHYHPQQQQQQQQQQHQIGPFRKPENDAPPVTAQRPPKVERMPEPLANPKATSNMRRHFRPPSHQGDISPPAAHLLQSKGPNAEDRSYVMAKFLSQQRHHDREGQWGDGACQGFHVDREGLRRQHQHPPPPPSTMAHLQASKTTCPPVNGAPPPPPPQKNAPQTIQISVKVGAGGGKPVRVAEWKRPGDLQASKAGGWDPPAPNRQAPKIVFDPSKPPPLPPPLPPPPPKEIPIVRVASGIDVPVVDSKETDGGQLQQVSVAPVPNSTKEKYQTFKQKLAERGSRGPGDVVSPTEAVPPPSRVAPEATKPHRGERGTRGRRHGNSSSGASSTSEHGRGERKRRTFVQVPQEASSNFKKPSTYVFDQDPSGRKIRPVETVSELSFAAPNGLDRQLARFLAEEDVERAMVLQQVMWPSLSAGKSFVGVAGGGGGKTVGYLIPMVNYLLTMGGRDPNTGSCSGYPYPPSDGGHGEAPLAVVVCPSWKKAVAVSGVLEEIIKSVKSPVRNDLSKLKALLVFEKEESYKTALINGVHVLVTTVPCLLRLTVGLGFTGLSRCCHLVFDDADATFEAFSLEVSAVMAKHTRAHQENAEMLNQVIVTSSAWTEPVRQFVHAYMKKEDVSGCSVGISRVRRVN